MSTTAVAAVNSTAQSFSRTSTTATGANSATSQRDLFMSLLVAQLKNQDPLSPQDGTAFVAQLAQFNSLDQLVGIRQSIEQLSALLQQPNPTTTTKDPQTSR